MGYKSHVIAPGAHAWTEVEMTFRKKDGKDTICVMPSQPDFMMAGVMNLKQMSRSERDYLSARN
jgi:hypothetical protein